MEENKAHVMLYVENSKEFTKKNYSKVVEYKINIKKSTAFLM